MSRKVRAALVQTVNAYRDMPERVEDLPSLAPRLADVRRANLDHHVELMRVAKQSGVRVIGFGELFAAPYFALGTDPMWFALAEDAATGPTVTCLREAARRESMIVVAPIYELSPDGRRFNTAVVIDEHGEVLGKCRKAHVTDGENELGTFKGSYYYEASDGENGASPANVSKNPFFPVFQTSVGRLGVAICYDRHFEGVMWSLAKEGAEIVFAPAVTFGAKSQRLWQLEFQVDAGRNEIFIGGSNRKGAEAPWAQPYFGHSQFVGPNGVLANVSTHDNLIIADLDLAELRAPDPAGWNIARDIRHDIYTRRG